MLSTNGANLRLLMQDTFVDQYQTYEVRIVILDSKSVILGENLPPYLLRQPSEHVAA